jgi:MFS family permease
MPTPPAAETPDLPHSPFAAFQHRDFSLYQVARMLVVLGLEMQSVGVAWQVYELTRRPLDLGYVGLIQFAPAVLLMLIVGHTADRFDRRIIMLFCFSGYAICATLLFLYTTQGAQPLQAHRIFLILALLGVARAFSAPTSQAMLPTLVPDVHFQNAVAWSSSIFQLATIAGPAIAGVIYAVGRGPATIYATSATLFLCGIVLVAFMHIRLGRLEKRNISMETMLAGFKYVWKEKIVLGSISLDLFAVLLGGAVALLPVYADQILHVGARGLGVMRATPAIGAAIMGGLLAARPLRKKSGIIMFTCVAIFGTATIIFGLSRNFYLSLVMLAAIGASDMVSVVIRGTLVQINTPPDMRGRVSAVNMLFIGTSNEFGEFESGVTAQWLGAVRAVVIGGVGTLAVVATWLGLFPELRNVSDLRSKN